MDPKQRQAALTISFRGRKVLLLVKSVVAEGVKEDEGGVAVDSPSIHRFIDSNTDDSIDGWMDRSIDQFIDGWIDGLID